MAEESRNYLFTWKIKNFSMCFSEIDVLVSSTFKAESIGGSEWYLRCFPKGSTKKCDSYVSCFLRRVENDSKEMTHYSLEIIGDDGEILRRVKDENIFENKGWGSEKFIWVDKLNEKMKNWKKDILTIRCYLSSCSKPLKQPAVESEGWTVFGVDRCSFLWDVRFSDSPNWNESKTIYIEKNAVFEITITAAGDEIAINIRNLEETPKSSKHLRYKISLMSLSGIEYKSISVSHTFSCVQKEMNISSFFSKNDLLNRMNDVMQNGLFTLNFEVSASTGQYMSEIKYVKYETCCIAHASPSDSVSTLQDDFRNMLKTSKNSDIKFRVENVTVPAHKYILGARSPVFSAMFDQNMLESETGVIDIQDLDVMTLNSLLEFVYTELVSDLNFEKALKLSIAADKYQIPSLTENCSKFLASHLSVENVCDVYGLADLINHTKLKYCAMEFIKMKSSEVLSSNTWSDWMKENINLANEILFKLALEFSP